jgi:hypothetical protein
MNGIITIYILSNLLKIPIIEFANLLDDFLIRLMLSTKIPYDHASCS